MSSDLEAGFIPPQNAEILAYDERLNTSSDSLEPSTSKVLISTQVSGVKISTCNNLKDSVLTDVNLELIEQRQTGDKTGDKRSSGKRQ